MGIRDEIERKYLLRRLPDLPAGTISVEIGMRIAAPHARLKDR